MPARAARRSSGRPREMAKEPERAVDIAEAVMAVLGMHPRALWPEFAIFANNPWQED